MRLAAHVAKGCKSLIHPSSGKDTAKTKGVVSNHESEGRWRQISGPTNRNYIKLTRYEQETVINFNAEDPDATVYTRDKAVMRKLDALVTEFPEVFQCIGETDIDNTYTMPKSRVKYRKLRKISGVKREQSRKAMKKVNSK